MEIRVNGDRVTCEDGITLEHLIEELGYVKNRIAVEVNGDIIEKANYESYKIAPADTLEIVMFVGGGSGKNKSGSGRH